MVLKRKLRHQRPNRSLGRYIKMRRDDQVLISMKMSNEINADFKEKEKVSRYACTWKRYRRHKLGALYTSLRNHWMYHDEGGWTEDIDPTNVAETSRYRRKMEKSEDINTTIDKWGTFIDDRLDTQDLAAPECMFDIDTASYLEAAFHAEHVAAFMDPAEVKRPVKHICWLGPGHLAGAYGSHELAVLCASPSLSYVWDVENSVRPLVTLTSASPATCIECHDKRSEQLISGHVSGGLALWDLRLGQQPVEVTGEGVGHREVVTAVAWTLDSGGYEVFSGGTEGSIRWWDLRYLEEPVQVVSTEVLSEESHHTPGVMALEINAEDRNKYMVGTQSGHVLYGDRLAEQPSLSIQTRWECPAYVGPVNSLERSEECPNIVLASGDYQLKLFSDELMYSPIMTLRMEPRLLTCATWSPSYPAVIHATLANGVVDTWNLQTNPSQPVHTLKVCEEALLSARCRQEGDVLALGSSTGDVHLVRYTDNLYLCDSQDEVHLQDLFSRELSKEIQAADRTSLPCFRNLKVITASEQASSNVSSIRLSELSVPEKWKSHSPVRMRRSLSPNSSDSWETDSETDYNGKPDDKVTSPAKGSKLLSGAHSTKSFRDETKSGRLDVEVQLGKLNASVERAASADAEVASKKKVLPSMLKSPVEEGKSHVHFSSPVQVKDKQPPAVSTSPTKSEHGWKSKRTRPRSFKKSILEAVARLRAEGRRTSEAKELPEKFVPIEELFQTEDVTAAGKTFRKVAKAHRENMWTQFEVPLRKRNKKKKKPEGDDDEDDSDSECVNDEEIDEEEVENLPKVTEEELPKEVSQSKKKEKQKKEDVAMKGNSDSIKGIPQREAFPTDKSTARKKDSPNKSKSPAMKSTARNESKDRRKDKEPDKRMEEMAGLRKKKKSKRKKKLAGKKSSRKDSSSPWKY